MNKKYMKPAVSVVKLEMNAMVCLSAVVDGTQANESALGRRQKWEDDDEEDF